MLRKRIVNLPEAPARVVKIDVSNLGIVSYDEDNGYPQRMDTLVKACSTAKQSVDLLAGYTFGQGFQNIVEGDNIIRADFYKSFINNKRLTPDGLLKRLANDKAEFRGFAFHVNYNALYQIESINYVPWETTRIGYGEKNEGKICLHPDWYNTDKYGKGRRVNDVVVVDRYNPDPVEIENQVIAAGGWESYKGQIYWHSDDFESYPLASIDPVLESVLAEIASDKTTTNNLQNNFQLKTIWVEKGGKVDETEQEEHTAEVQKFIGPDGKPVCVVFSEDPDGKDVPDLKTFTSSINDKLFAYTDEKVRAKIYRAFKQPAILHSDYMGTNGYNKDQLRDSMEYYTNYTHPERIFFEELFREIFTKFHIDINPSQDYSIVPLANLKSESNANTTNI